MKGIIPSLAGADHGIKDGQQLADASDDGDFLGFSGENEAIREGADDGVEGNGGHSGPVEATSDRSAPAEDGAFAVHLARITIAGCNTDQGTDFPAGQAAQLRHLGEQRGERCRAEAAHTGKPVGKLGMMGFDVPGKLGLDFVELGADGDDHRLDTPASGGMADRKPLVLGDLHGDELPPAGHQGLQRLRFGRGHDADEAIPRRVACQHLGQFSNRLGVDPLGFGELAHRLGDISRLARLDDGHCPTGCLQSAGQISLQPTRGFHDDQINRDASQPSAEEVMTGVIVGEGRYPTANPNGGIDALFGDVDTDNKGFRHVPVLPCLQIRPWVKPLFGRQRNGHEGAPSAHTRAWCPRGETGGAAAPETTDAVEL